MTVSSETFKTSLSGDGSVTTFAIGNISFTDNSEIDVYIRNETASPPTEVLQTITTNYFMTNSAGAQINPATHIKFDTSEGHTIPTGSPVNKVVIKRKIDLTQSTDYASGDAFPADSHEAALDRLTLLVQQMQEQLDRSWLFPETYTGLSNVKMPEPGNNAVVRWNSDGTALISDLSLATATYKVSPSADDGTADYLEEKLKPGTGLSASTVNPGGDEEYTFTIDSTVTTLTGTQVLANKTLTSPALTSPVINTSVSGSAIDTDLASTSSSDDTLASAKAIKTYVDAVTTSLNAQDLDFSGDSGGAQNVDLDTQSLTVAGGTGIATTGSSNTLTVDIDSTVTTLSGTQTLTNKTLTTPVLDTPTLFGDTASAGSILFKEDTDNGTNAVTLKGPASTADVTVTLPAATDTLVGKDTTDTLTNKTLTSPVLNTGVSGTAVKDEDNMASDSATHLATQQSIKAYVDDNAGGGGAGSIDTLFTLQAKSADAPTSGSGNDAVFLGGGTLSNGAISQETTAADLIGAEKVFKYNTTGDSNRNYWYHEETINSGYAGKNMVLQLQYYTRNGGDGNSFRFVARDGTKPIISVTADSTNTITGTVDATIANVAVVGDRIIFKDSSHNIYYRYITTVTNNGGGNGKTATHSVTYGYSGSDITATGKVVTGVMTDELDYLSANDMAASTNNEAKVYRKQMAFGADCTTFQFGFHCLDTDVDVELYYDDIALSANQFLQVSSQGETEQGWWADPDGFASNTNVPYFGTEHINTTGKVVTVTNSSASNTGWTLTANKKAKVSVSANFANGASGDGWGAWLKNAPQSLDETNVTSSTMDAYRLAISLKGTSEGTGNNCSITIVLEKGDTLRYQCTSTTLTSSPYGGQIILAATPEVSSAILLNSQDEIFTDWVSYTPTFTNMGSPGSVEFFWRRNGTDIDVRGRMTDGSGASSPAKILLPLGYTINAGSLPASASTSAGHVVGKWGRDAASVGGSGGYVLYNGATDGVGISLDNNTGAAALDSQNGNYMFGGSGLVVSFNFKVPIQGWTSSFNPVLSMPLVDFGTYDNVYTCYTPGTASSGIGDLVQSQNFLSGLSTSAGTYNYTFESGKFTQAPLVTCSMAQAGSGGNASVGTVTTSGFTIETNNSSNTKTDYSHAFTVTRQGADYRQPPQPTAAVIKPAVAVLYHQLDTAVTAQGELMVDGDTWYATALNTIQGESWFVTLSGSGTTGIDGNNTDFTLEPGTYELTGSMVFAAYLTVYCYSSFWDVTNGVRVGVSTANIMSSSAPWDGQIFPVEFIVTITTPTKYRFQGASHTGGSYARMGLITNISIDRNPTLTQVKIRKLK